MTDHQTVIDELRAQLTVLRDRKAENDELLGKITTARAELDELAATTTSPDGTVTVVAGPGGIVRSVQFTDAALHTDAATLSATVTATVRDAVSRAGQQQLDIVRTRVGKNVDPAQILGPQAIFATSATDPVQPAPAPAVDDDDDEPPASYMNR
jgi:DNA-binding protein YbaB